MSETIDEHHLSPTRRPPRRLVRADDGRWLGGVCAGLGRYFDINPLVYRIAFAALVTGRRHRPAALPRRLPRDPGRARRGVDRRREDACAAATSPGSSSASACSASARSSRSPRRASGPATGTSGSRRSWPERRSIWWRVSTRDRPATTLAAARRSNRRLPLPRARRRRGRRSFAPVHRRAPRCVRPVRPALGARRLRRRPGRSRSPRGR